MRRIRVICCALALTLAACTGKEAFIPLMLPEYLFPSTPKHACEYRSAVDARISGCPAYDVEAARITRANANGKQAFSNHCFLEVAAWRRQRELVFELLENGADPKQCGPPVQLFSKVDNRWRSSEPLH